MKSKAATCKFNSNRAAYKIVEPYCNFPIPDIILPPSIYINQRHLVSEQDCKVCKCYIKES